MLMPMSKKKSTTGRTCPALRRDRCACPVHASCLYRTRPLPRFVVIEPALVFFAVGIGTRCPCFTPSCHFDQSGEKKMNCLLKTQDQPSSRHHYQPSSRHHYKTNRHHAIITKRVYRTWNAFVCCRIVSVLIVSGQANTIFHTAGIHRGGGKLRAT